jgi:hypothetical protein
MLSATCVKRLVDFNWEGVGRYPTLIVSNLRARNFSETMDTLTRLAQSGILAPYPELAQFVTRELGLPQREQSPVVSGQLPVDDSATTNVADDIPDEVATDN